MPIHLLQRRYAAGEISTEEYEERKTRIERDTPSSER
ncbi:MAG: SHOCT domain-containing protein [Gammaproteobacteria bacterium]